MSDTFSTLTRLLFLISTIQQSSPINLQTLNEIKKEVQTLREEYNLLQQTLHHDENNTEEPILAAQKEVERLFDWIVTFCDIQLFVRERSKQILVPCRPPPVKRRRSCCSVNNPRPQYTGFKESLSRAAVVCGSERFITSAATAICAA
jgi:hypothetical protein